MHINWKKFLYTGKKAGEVQWVMQSLEERDWHRKNQNKEENVIPQTVEENGGFLENALQIMTSRPWWKHCVARELKVSREKVDLSLGLGQPMVPFCLESFKQKDLNSNHEQTDSRGLSLAPSLCKAGCRDLDGALPSLLSCSQLQEPVHNAFLAKPASMLLSSSTELRNALPTFPPSPVLTWTAEPCFLLGQITLGI